MRGWVLAFVLLCGCPPDLDRFRVVGEPGVDAGPRGDAGPGVDAGPGADAGPGVDGGPPPGGSVLASSDCAAVVTSPMIDESFEDMMTEYRALSGDFRVEGGHIVLVAPEYAFLESLGAYRDVLVCAHATVGRTTPSHQLGVGLRGPMHGVNLVLMAHEARVRVFSLEPETNVVVGEQPLTGWASGQHDFAMLIYLSGTRVHAEVKDQTTGEVVVVRGTYRGVDDAVRSTFEGSPLAEDVLVHDVVVGFPTSAAAAILNGG